MITLERPQRYLTDRHGRLKDLPEGLHEVVSCPACGVRLTRTSLGWLCGNSLTHTKIIKDELIEERLEESMRLLGLRRPLARNLLKFLKRRQAYLAKQGELSG